DAPARHERHVGGVHDRVHVERGDVGLQEAQAVGDWHGRAPRWRAVRGDRIGVSRHRRPLPEAGQTRLRAGREARRAVLPRAFRSPPKGWNLTQRAGELRAAGRKRVNVSLDTLDPERFRALARRDRFAEVLAGLDAARAAGFAPIKVNAVLMRGTNDDEVVPL